MENLLHTHVWYAIWAEDEAKATILADANYQPMKW